MSRAANAILGGGVFVAVFAAAWFTLPYLGSVGAPNAASTVVDEEARIMAVARGPEAKRKKTGKRTAEEVDAGNQRASVRVIADLQGKKVSEELIEAAETDAPPSKSYTRFATMVNADGHTVVCTSQRVDGRIEHGMMTITATEAEHDSGVQLPKYVLSGCAEAVRDHSRLLTPIQLMQTMSGLLPKTSRFDKDRAEFAALGREYMTRR